MISDDRTYRSPGKCPKCLDSSPWLDWVTSSTYDRYANPVDTSHLEAHCVTCGFRWKVIAADEMGETEYPF